MYVIIIEGTLNGQRRVIWAESTPEILGKPLASGNVWEGVVGSRDLSCNGNGRLLAVHTADGQENLLALALAVCDILSDPITRTEELRIGVHISGAVSSKVGARQIANGLGGSIDEGKSNVVECSGVTEGLEPL